jgi:hypothetical protein
MALISLKKRNYFVSVASGISIVLAITVFCYFVFDLAEYEGSLIMLISFNALMAFEFIRSNRFFVYHFDIDRNGIVTLKYLDFWRDKHVSGPVKDFSIAEKYSYTNRFNGTKLCFYIQNRYILHQYQTPTWKSSLFKTAMNGLEDAREALEPTYNDQV